MPRKSDPEGTGWGTAKQTGNIGSLPLHHGMQICIASFEDSPMTDRQGHRFNLRKFPELHRKEDGSLLSQRPQIWGGYYMREMGFSHSAKSGAVTVTHAKLSDPYPEVIGHLPVAGHTHPIAESSCLFLHATVQNLCRVSALDRGSELEGANKRNRQ